MTRFPLLLCACVAATPLSAEDLRPAPAYFVETFFELTMAEALASACPAVGMDLLAAGAATTDLRLKLATDGFDPDAPLAQMIDPGPALRDLQDAFLVKHPGLADPTEDSVCAVARAEIADETPVGGYLFEAAALR